MTEIHRCGLCRWWAASGGPPVPDCPACKRVNATPRPANPLTDPRSLRAVPQVPLTTTGAKG